MTINRVMLTGNLGSEPELRRGANGSAVLQMSLAVNERRGDGNGGYTTYTNWFDCAMFGNRAESVSSYLHKGDKVSIEGRLHYRQWEKDGQKRSAVSVYVDEIEFMSRSDRKPQQPSQPKPSPAVSGVYDDDIPF